MVQIAQCRFQHAVSPSFFSIIARSLLFQKGLLMQSDVLIIGAGAAGLAAAARLRDTALTVTLAERLPRIGKKLLSTGNGRCNFSNTDMQPTYYHEAAPFVSALYERTPPHTVLRFFEDIGLMSLSDEGRLYPRTNAASSVLDVLRFAISSPNIHVLTDTEITGITAGDGFTAQTQSGETLRAKYVIFAPGGAAAPHLGTDGRSYALLKKLNLPVTALRPSLVQLKCRHPALPSLKGIRTQATVSLHHGGETHSETGELLFADYGVSGVCVFQLSRFVTEHPENVFLTISFLPEIPAADTSTWLWERISRFPDLPAENLFTGVLQRMIVLAILKDAGISREKRSGDLSPAERNRLTEELTAFKLPVVGTLGMEHAQITRGGLALGVVNPNTLEALPGFYACGEVLDCDGICGGYNLHFAFTCGITAADDILTKEHTGGITHDPSA